MKIKTAYIIERSVRLLLTILMFPFFACGFVLEQLARPFRWLIEETSYLMDIFGHYLFKKSKMFTYVKNPTCQRILTAISAYKLKKEILKERPELSEDEF